MATTKPANERFVFDQSNYVGSRILSFHLLMLIAMFCQGLVAQKLERDLLYSGNLLHREDGTMVHVLLFDHCSQFSALTQLLSVN